MHSRSCLDNGSDGVATKFPKANNNIIIRMIKYK